MNRYHIVTFLGTRPEILKMSRIMPLFDQIFTHTIVHTGQNYAYELNKIFFDQMGLRAPDHFLGVAQGSIPQNAFHHQNTFPQDFAGQHFSGAPESMPDQGWESPLNRTGSASAAPISPEPSTPCQVIARVLERSEAFLMAVRPDAVMIYGDTNSCLAALAAKRLQIPIFHMEAGNRCFDMRVPEEINRRLIDHLSDVNLVLTEHARRYLLAEGLPGDRIFVVGSHMREVLDHYAPSIASSDVLDRLALEPRQYLLASLHREETVDNPQILSSAFQALRAAGQTYGVPVIISTHPRTRARLKAMGFAWDADQSLHFHPPFGFFDYVHLQQHSLCTISDSGTLAEEAAILGFPGVWARQSHERPEAVDAGAVVLWNPGLPTTLASAIELAADNPGPKQVRDYAAPKVSHTIAALVQGYLAKVLQETWKIPPSALSGTCQVGSGVGKPATTHIGNLSDTLSPRAGCGAFGTGRLVDTSFGPQGSSAPFAGRMQ